VLQVTAATMEACTKDKEMGNGGDYY